MRTTGSHSIGRRGRSSACASRMATGSCSQGLATSWRALQDRGDLWELNKGLDGGSRVAMTTHQKVPSRGNAVFSDEGKGESGIVVNGPVFSELRVARPFGSGRFATTVRIYDEPAPDRYHDEADQSGEVCPIPGTLPDDDQRGQDDA